MNADRLTYKWGHDELLVEMNRQLAKIATLSAENAELRREREAIVEAARRLESLHVYDTRDAGPCYTCDPVNEVAEVLRSLSSEGVE